MTSKTVKPLRCAIYTRVSTEAGLEQDFNSLDAQYDAGQAYIRSQAQWPTHTSAWDVRSMTQTQNIERTCHGLFRLRGASTASAQPVCGLDFLCRIVNPLPPSGIESKPEATLYTMAH